MLRWLANQSLGIKFTLMVITILISTTSVVTYIQIRSQQQLLLDSLIAKGQALGNFVSLISPQLVLSYDFEGMNDHMREISQEQDVVYGILIAENGINLTDYLNKKNDYVIKASISQADESALVIINQINQNPEIIPLKFPVITKQQKLGHLIVGMSRKQVDKRFRQDLLNMMLTNAAIIAFLSICIYVSFRFMAMRPIENLRSGLQRVTEGDLQTRIDIHANDEIGSLTNSFNDMASQLELTLAEKDDLARKYQKQAREFSALNADLNDRVQESSHIMRDLHDDVGAKLLTLVHRAESTKNEEIARAGLKNLRETIRGLGKNETTIELSDALANWHDEVTERLEAARIKLAWQQPEDLPEKLLNNRQLINISRILREAISNSIRHGLPKIVEVATQLENSNFRMTVCNDALNDDIDNWEPGTGINNMQTRADELGATIKWFSLSQNIDQKMDQTIDQNITPQIAAKTIIQNGICVEVICPLVKED